jgi:hypothetical protein
MIVLDTILRDNLGNGIDVLAAAGSCLITCEASTICSWLHHVVPDV